MGELRHVCVLVLVQAEGKQRRDSINDRSGNSLSSSPSLIYARSSTSIGSPFESPAFTFTISPPLSEVGAEAREATGLSLGLLGKSLGRGYVSGDGGEEEERGGTRAEVRWISRST